MSVLVNPQHEKFCLNYLSGMNRKDAAIAAGYGKKNASSVATHLLQKPLVAKRMEELKLETTNAKIMDITERKIRLSEIGRARLTEFVDDNGNVKLDGEHNAALQEVAIEDWKGGTDEIISTRTKKVRLHSPTQAIDLLNKMDKIYTDAPSSVTNNLQINIIVKEEKTRELVNKIISGERLIANGNHDAH